MTAPKRTRTRQTDPHPDEVDAVLRASRALVGIAASSMAGIEDVVTIPQFRVLVLIYTRGPVNLGAVADALDVNPSNASRTCDRLIRAGLLDRRASEADRRNIALTLTPAGRRLVDKVTRRRRNAIQRILRQMPASDRAGLANALAAFADAAGEPVTDAGILSLL